MFGFVGSTASGPVAIGEASPVSLGTHEVPPFVVWSRPLSTEAYAVFAAEGANAIAATSLPEAPDNAHVPPLFALI